ncbi:hypothetical protein D0C28_24805 [Rhizobium sp. AU243]|nr:hypothetical protein D0C28_24805 [Rhizobium sp. AU243]
MKAGKVEMLFTRYALPVPLPSNVLLIGDFSGKQHSHKASESHVVEISFYLAMLRRNATAVQGSAIIQHKF